MRQRCETCGESYDDEIARTICPHQHLAGDYCKQHDLYSCPNHERDQRGSPRDRMTRPRSDR